MCHKCNKIFISIMTGTIRPAIFVYNGTGALLIAMVLFFKTVDKTSNISKLNFVKDCFHETTSNYFTGKFREFYFTKGL